MISMLARFVVRWSDCGIAQQVMAPSQQRKRSRAPLDWTEHEDAVLFQHIEEHGAKKWTMVSQALQGSKTANQCRLRWHAINPERCNEPFTEDANEHILRFVDECIAANDGVRPKKMKYVVGGCGGWLYHHHMC